MTLTMLSIAN
uniref:Uncharacterized protein n=1 Tax=Rhizophora mucronata TaxID=61149 RepID=A0A2P2R3C0_RHIMU